MTAKILIGISFLAIGLQAFSQKLPNIQQESQRPLSKIKIDGKAGDWNNKFEAYNKNTSFFYTIANDDENLYVVIQITDPIIINKTISAGISLIIAKPGEKIDEHSPSITYPIFDVKDKPNLDIKNTPKIIPGDKSSIMKADSFMTDNNLRLANKSKWIKVTGIKNIDTLISVYNREGIKAAESFDNKMTYTFELSIALKNLELSPNAVSKFSYQIKSNGASFDGLNGITVTRNNFGQQTALHIGAGAMPPATIPLMTATTDFKGEYILAKR